MFSDNLTQKIAEAAKKIMDEQLKGNQKKIDKNHNNKIDGQDFAILRGEKKANEEVERIDELSKTTLGSYVKKAAFDLGQKGISAGQYAKKKQWSPITKKMNKRTDSIVKATDRLTKEEIELEEGIEDRLEAARAKAKAAGKPIKDKPAAPKSNVRKVEGHAYGGAKQKDEPEEDDDTSMKSTKKGTFKRRYNTKTYSEMVAAYKEDGLKALLFKEEPTNDEFTAEVKAAQAKSEGKGKKAEVAKAAVQGVKNEETHTKVEVLDFNDTNGVKRSQIDLEEDSVEEEVRVLDVSKSNAGVRPKTPEERNRAAAAVKSARANKPLNSYTGKTVTGAGSVGAGQRQAGKPVSHIAVHEEAEEEIDERSMTDAEMAKREKIVKSMKKGLSGFKQRYGDRAKNVMYATATKQAMKED